LQAVASGVTCHWQSLRCKQ